MESWLTDLGDWASKNSWVIGLATGPAVIYYGTKLLRRIDAWIDTRWAPKKWPESTTTYTRVTGPRAGQSGSQQQLPPE